MTTPEKHTERIAWIDTAKAIAIFCVMLGHTGIYNISKVMDSFHMPLFFILAGFFIVDSIEKKSFSNFFLNKFWRLFVPSVLISILLLIPCNYVINQLSNCVIYYNPFDRIIGSLICFRDGWQFKSHLWFLPCLFVSSLMFYCIWKYSKRPYIWSILFCVTGFLYSNIIRINLPFSLDVALVAIGFMSFGVYIKNYLDFMNWKYAILLLTVFVGCVYINFEQETSMWNGYYGYILAFIGSAISGSLLILYIAKKLPIVSFIAFIGLNSLAIYGLHYLFLFSQGSMQRLFPWFNTNIATQIIYSFLFSCLIILVCIPIIKLCKKYTPWLIGEWQPKKKLQQSF